MPGTEGLEQLRLQARGALIRHVVFRQPAERSEQRIALDITIGSAAILGFAFLAVTWMAVSVARRRLGA